MKRIQEKVKDIVEVRSYQSLRDFNADPSLTLTSYHFTDATAELMASWLDKIANVQGYGGAACALAGYRGVGKSHFLAALGALVGRPELRTKVAEPHVAASVQRLMRRHYPMVYLRRGSHPTLFEELKDAVKTTFETAQLDALNSFADIVKAAAEGAGELPLILLIDTAIERGSRVTRDDGPFLGEIAETAKRLNVFVGVALDDDISGADGSNLAIARTFNIDYLDQEHLYKVVNSNIFPKNNLMQPVLHDIYEYFREVLPNFRWSEQRFSALYPLHPAILEIAPFVRLYVHDFALLGFASEAGQRILGRPANSLIALDEVFDRAEQSLRKIDDLNEAFVAFDKLNTEVVAGVPVMQRLQAKLVLKALLLLSLDGQGTTADEISASMLIFDESDPEKAGRTVHDLVKTFAAALPDDIRIDSEEGRETRYGFKVASKDDLNKALAEAVTSNHETVIPRMLRRLMQERFDDCTFSQEFEDVRRDWMDSQIVWRGGIRRGRIHWQADDFAGDANSTAPADVFDWETIIDLRADAVAAPKSEDDLARVIWKPDKLTVEEIDTFMRFDALSTNTELRDKFSEQLGPALHSHSRSVEKIFNRVFLEDGVLSIEGFDYNFTEDARSAKALSALFSIMLEPLFETRYPSHPYFRRNLGMAEVATLAADLYNPGRQNLTEVQELSDTFAAPLGLVRSENGVFVPEAEETVTELPLVSGILELVRGSKEPYVALKQIYAELRKPPFGLVREAQHLILCALVAQRSIEFVTSKGDRINWRSLDLKIIWDDVIGVARPVEASYADKKLTRWAVLFSGDESFVLDSAPHREKLREKFTEWAADWKRARVLEQFYELPDETLNTSIWRTAAHASKTLGGVAETIRSLLDGTISLEESLDRIADTFSDSEAELQRSKDELEVVESFVKGAGLRDEITSYLALCETTDDGAVEEIRENLIRIADASCAEPNAANNREMGYLWDKFLRTFADYFAGRHDEVMKTHSLYERYHEIMRSDGWWEFENLAQLSIFPRRFWADAVRICREFNGLDCQFDVREAIKQHPFCACQFTLARAGYLEKLPAALLDTVTRGLEHYHQTLSGLAHKLTPILEEMAKKSDNKDITAAAEKLTKTLRSDAPFPTMTIADITVLRSVVSGAAETERVFISPEDVEDLISGFIPETPRPTVADQVSDDVVVLNS